MNTIAERKAALRAQAIALRMGFDPAAGEALAGVVLREVPLPSGAIVAGLWPLRGEMDLRPLLHALHDRGHPIVLPQTPPRGSPLIFRLWSPGCAMLPERFGTQRPDGPIAVPDVIFVPLLAFDSRGYRLGYGGGYYDRTLQTLPLAQAVGFAYAAQRVEEVPTEPHDVPLRLIATELGIFQAEPRLDA
jgi:5-formyltetrahydrofolate cyclo-ligase